MTSLHKHANGQHYKNGKITIFQFLLSIHNIRFVMELRNLPPGSFPKNPNAVIIGLSGSSGLGRTEIK